MRVYFSVRDERSRSHLASLDLAIDGERFEVLGDVRGPLLSPGPRGAFDADGVTVTSFVEAGGRLHAYYLGWTVGRSVPFTNFIGLAAADNMDGPFERVSPAPVIGRSRHDPFTVGYPCVLRDGGSWRMWYGSHVRWGNQGLEMEHIIRVAESLDGVTWAGKNEIALPLDHANPAEFAVSRPWVVRDPSGWSMWLCRRAPDYGLGYAHSSDGSTWTRADHLLTFLDQPSDWDSEQSYPCVFDLNGRRYMLYCGVGYGRTGFGLAILED